MILDEIGFFEDAPNPPPYYLLQNESNYNAQKIISYLESGFRIRSWQEYRKCCFSCGAEGKEMGCSELSDGRWVWTDDLVHYVKYHYIDLPVSFLSYVEFQNFSMNIAVELKKDLVLEKELFAKELRGNENIIRSREKWKQWLELKSKSVSENIVKRLAENIKPFKLDKKNIPKGFKLPGSWS